MSDEQNSQKQKRSMLATTADDFVRFLEEKSPESNCPVCEGETWTVISPSFANADSYRLVTSLKDGNRPQNLSTFALFCDNCGYLRQHLSRVVKKWVDENPVEPELDFEPPEQDEIDAN
ncbi:hypothetical protein QMK52_18685 [Pseudomonas sp. P9_2]|uniref:hypothetical protein n=1 Tax=Pseudomonas sp. P9_2 TaxID=3043447 RepID=UPI002A35F874|nr:hypothetical protein [Pseudomonas sp. P9_2]WPN50920.1 hypothetical protein QMK52_18685 [Pseudomonas sp. P9_2]